MVSIFIDSTSVNDMFMRNIFHLFKTLFSRRLLPARQEFFLSLFSACHAPCGLARLFVPRREEGKYLPPASSSFPIRARKALTVSAAATRESCPIWA